MKNNLFVYFLLLTSYFLLPACGSDDDDTLAPKPRAFFRLNYPEKAYVKYDSACPFTFEMPSYAKMENDKNAGAEPCWLNMNLNGFNGTLHLSYKQVNKNLDKYIQDTYTLASKHEVKASGIEEEIISKDSVNVFGLLYNIGGNAASSIQFYLTDRKSVV